MTGRLDQNAQVGTAVRISAVAPVTASKRVFCIDNISVWVEKSEMAEFLRHDLNIEFINLNEVRSRRRRNDLNFDERKAFRLCIFNYDVDKLLDPDAWPRGVRISDWFFKQPRTEVDIPGGNGNVMARPSEDMEVALGAGENESTEGNDRSTSTVVEATSLGLASTSQRRSHDQAVAAVPVSPPAHESTSLHELPDHSSSVVNAAALDASTTVIYDGASTTSDIILAQS
jgi:hypothetical protein